MRGRNIKALYCVTNLQNPTSIVVLPPVNTSPDVKATYSMLAQVTHPLAEAGYYVLPVALVDDLRCRTSSAPISQWLTRERIERSGRDARCWRWNVSAKRCASTRMSWSWTSICPA